MCEAGRRKRECVGENEDDKNSEKLSQTLIKALNAALEQLPLLVPPRHTGFTAFLFGSQTDVARGWRFYRTRSLVSGKLNSPTLKVISGN